MKFSRRRPKQKVALPISSLNREQLPADEWSLPTGSLTRTGIILDRLLSSPMPHQKSSCCAAALASSTTVFPTCCLPTREAIHHTSLASTSAAVPQPVISE